MSAEITAEDLEVMKLDATPRMLRLLAAYEALTADETLPDGTYRPSKLAQLESDREERDYFEARYAETRAALESSQAHARNLGEQLNATTADAEQAEARAAVLRDAIFIAVHYFDVYEKAPLSGPQDDVARSLRKALSTLDPAAERLLAERKLLRSIAAIANSISDCVTEFGKETDGACACHEYFEHMDTALTALRDFDKKETK